MTTDLQTTDDPHSICNRIICELEAGGERLPEEAIREARQHREHIIPHLIHAIKDATARAAAGDTVEGNAHFFALFLLTEFRAKEALPAILEAISLPDELPFDLFGDAVTENLSSVLAAFAGDTPELLDTLIRNRSLNEYVRWQAAGTYLYLVRDGRLTRDDAVDRLRHHLREAIANEDVNNVAGLILALLDFSPREALGELQEAYRLDLVDPAIVNLQDFEQSISDGESEFRRHLERCRPTGIEDTIAELKTWHAFADNDRSASPATSSNRWETAPAPEDAWEGPRPIRNTQPRIGRNDPCPCGSGKKFKKCCGAN